MSSESAFRRLAVMRSFEGGIELVSIMMVALGGSAMTFSMSCVAECCNLLRKMEDMAVDVKSEV